MREFPETVWICRLLIARIGQELAGYPRASLYNNRYSGHIERQVLPKQDIPGISCRVFSQTGTIDLEVQKFP